MPDSKEILFQTGSSAKKAKEGMKRGRKRWDGGDISLSAVKSPCSYSIWLDELVN
jgi:hypothetical protein